MFPYLPHTSKDRKAMMERIGIQSIEELFDDIPESIRLKDKLKLNRPHSELEIKKICKDLSDMNVNIQDYICFIGAGYYDHYIPSVVDHMLLRSEFYTAYTPYQAEMSQGYLQAIFEYQTMICELTGMDVSNASMYDGATATAEAGFMAINVKRKRSTVLISKTVHPEVRKVCKTYFDSAGFNLVEIEMKDGKIDLEDLESKLSDDVAGVIIQYPNFFGIIEDIKKITKKVHANDSLMIINADPIALGILASPGELGADIAIGEGQSLGNPVSFGGPTFGFFAAKEDFMRYMPGRIVGQTTDHEGNRGYVLTLQAREQHIRRHRATSNICSNQALNALAALVYLSVMGKKGLRQVAENSFKKAHYLMEKINQLDGFKTRFKGPFFKEFVIKTEYDVDSVLKTLLDNGILGGYALGSDYPELSDCFMVAVTEKRSKEEIDQYIQILEGVK
ncbi:glycine dehydrogenase (aminomethyl-transferring) [Anoxybacter fermentans]|uniref:Probable glycine dehydrogenase (decarboxylating) subunit 1 n=1 Tax=Anoxybacter fermentans TaxID=1323375 RepID=A0A3S9SXG3_9FIRM|nr:aminomethyl-transferring glycine dehydrogenase subunit GcvPA [Anoxybacter fermentans]AZR72904.1 glycine dehydrogenase (aminomethyl-transferring) [Anoxybacter fermentans]